MARWRWMMIRRNTEADKGPPTPMNRYKSRSLWNCWSDRYWKEPCSWNHLIFKHP
jgi:hypothetical protein